METTELETPEVEILSPAGTFRRIAAMTEAFNALKLGMGSDWSKDQLRHAVDQTNWMNFLSDERVDEIMSQIADDEAAWAESTWAEKDRKATAAAESAAFEAEFDAQSGVETPENAKSEVKVPKVKSANTCATCSAVIPPTGKRGRPAKNCDSCKAAEPVKVAPKANICTLCNEAIPPSGKRGRPAKVHPACREAASENAAEAQVS